MELREEVEDVPTGYSGWPSVACVMSGRLAIVAAVVAVSAVFSASGTVRVASTFGVVRLVSVCFSGVFTTADVGKAVALTSTSVFLTGIGGETIVTGTWDMTVSIVIEVAAEVIISISVPCSGITVRTVVIGKVKAEVCVIMEIFVSGTVVGVSLIVTTVLATRLAHALAS